MAQIEHFNSQATTILLASLSREEYNKVQGLKSAKEDWDVLKTAHEGDELGAAAKICNLLRRLAAFVQLPVARGRLVGRIQDRMIEKRI